MADKSDDVYRTFMAEINSIGHPAHDDMYDRFRDALQAFEECDERECRTQLVAIRESFVRLGIAEEAMVGAGRHGEIERRHYELAFWLEVIDEVRNRVDQGDIQIARWLGTELSQWLAAHAREIETAH